MVLMPGCDTLGGDIIKTAFIWIAQNKVGNATDRKALWKEALEILVGQIIKFLHYLLLLKMFLQMRLLFKNLILTFVELK